MRIDIKLLSIIEQLEAENAMLRGRIEEQNKQLRMNELKRVLLTGNEIDVTKKLVASNKKDGMKSLCLVDVTE